jgi:hypothetical protein
MKAAPSNPKAHGRAENHLPLDDAGVDTTFIIGKCAGGSIP